MDGVALEAARTYGRLLRDRFGERVERVLVYGSRVRGDARTDSDVDILALVTSLTWREKMEAIDLSVEVSLANTLHLVPVVMSAEEFARLVELESRFAENVLREGVAA